MVLEGEEEGIGLLPNQTKLPRLSHPFSPIWSSCHKKLNCHLKSSATSQVPRPSCELGNLTPTQTLRECIWTVRPKTLFWCIPRWLEISGKTNKRAIASPIHCQQKSKDHPGNKSFYWSWYYCQCLGFRLKQHCIVTQVNKVYILEVLVAIVLSSK